VQNTVSWAKLIVFLRTKTAMPQAHCFLATEMALKAQKMAQSISFGK
jgi:hypothetical protein